MKHLYRILMLLTFTAMAVGCKSDYNFDNISLEVTVGNTNGIIIPVGAIEPITVASLMEESGLETDSNGYYAFNMNDSFEYTVELGTIDPIEGLIPTIDPISTEILGAINTALPSFSETRSLDFPEGLTGSMTIPEGFPIIGTEMPLDYETDTFESSFEITLPNEVAGVKTITFGENGEGSLVEFIFDLGGIADVSTNRVLEKFTLSMPSGFELGKIANDPLGEASAVSSSEGSTTNNTFTITNYSMTDSEIVVDFLIKSIDLSKETINEEGKMILDADISYSLNFKGEIKAGTVSATSPSVSINSTLEFHSATILTGDIAHPFAFTNDIDYIVEVPAEIEAIHSIAFAGEPHLSVELKVENSPVGSLELHNVEITLPDYIAIEAPEGWSKTNNVLSAEKIEILADGTNNTFINLPLSSIGPLEVSEGKVDLSSTIAISADARLASGQELTIGGNKEEIIITPIAKLDKLAIESVTGIVEPDLGEFLKPIEVSLGDLTSSLEGIEMDLNIAAPVLLLEVDNPIGIGIDAVIQIDAYKGGEVAQTITTPTISILPLEKTSIIITGEGSEVAYPDDASTLVYKIEGLSEMIGLLPDKLVLTLDAETNKQQPHTITLQDSYTFNVAYWVDAPISFSGDQDGHISYTTTIEDVDLSALADIDLTIESLAVNITSISTLPIDLSMNIELLDEENNPISCVVSSTEGKIAGSTSTEAKESECTILLDILYPTDAESTPWPFAEIARTKKLKCTIEGTTLNGGGLKPDQSISAQISLLLPEGITIDLESILPEEPEEGEEPNEEPEETPSE